MSNVMNSMMYFRGHAHCLDDVPSLSIIEESSVLCTLDSFLFALEQHSVVFRTLDFFNMGVYR